MRDRGRLRRGVEGRKRGRTMKRMMERRGSGGEDKERREDGRDLERRGEVEEEQGKSEEENTFHQ